MQELTLTQVTSIIQDFGIWVMFAYLYVQEKKSHKETIERYRDDLREVAGMRQRLNLVQDVVTEYKPQESHS